MLYLCVFYIEFSNLLRKEIGTIRESFDTCWERLADVSAKVSQHVGKGSPTRSERLADKWKIDEFVNSW